MGKFRSSYVHIAHILFSYASWRVSTDYVAHNEWTHGGHPQDPELIIYLHYRILSHFPPLRQMFSLNPDTFIFPK